MPKKSIFTRLLICNLGILLLYGFIMGAIVGEPGYLNYAVAATLFALTLCFACFRVVLAPLRDSLEALENGVAAFKDKDFSLTIQNRHYQEVDSLVSIYNELAMVMRHERMDIFQRELLLDTVIQSTPVALVLTNSRGAIVYSNHSARQLLNSRSKINGSNFIELLDGLSPVLKQGILDRSNSLITDQQDEQTVVYNLNYREFHLKGMQHCMYLIKNMTAEITRKESDMWKQVIRLISHELNNSLAPISSLTNSAKQIIDKPEHLHMLSDVLNTIGNRTEHLHNFISQYAEFSRLPKPNIKAVALKPFIEQLQPLINVPCHSDFVREEAHFDISQIEQVIINLVKNAKESGSNEEDVGVQIVQEASHLNFTIYDRGEGMSEQQVQQALLPFFTTKPKGTGVGLALCNEIISNHDGQLKLFNREHGGLAVSFSLELMQS